MKLKFTVIGLFSAMLLLVACSSNKPVVINAMHAPDIYDDGKFNPFLDPSMAVDDYPDAIFYTTDRQPSDDLDQFPFYENKRGHVLRLGTAQIGSEDDVIDWDELHRISLLKDRGRKYPLQVGRVNEIGILDKTFEPLIQYRIDEEVSDKPGIEYSRLINERLEKSSVKDIYLYVHGYKVQFDNPVLVSTELWHFLGYQGAFIAYAWPSTPSRLAYSADLESATYTARHLRQFIQYLAKETTAQRIHIIGYSAGTRVVIGALWDLALLHDEDTDAQMAKRYRLGQVMLFSSDFDRDVFNSAILDRLLNLSERTTVYGSATDRSLAMSSFLLSRNRLGELKKDEDVSHKVMGLLKPSQKLNFINVSGAFNSDEGNGHNYFRLSPWVSSDLLASLRYGLSPQQRGLVNTDDSAIWTFPEDYPQRLKRSIENVMKK